MASLPASPSVPYSLALVAAPGCASSRSSMIKRRSSRSKAPSQCYCSERGTGAVIAAIFLAARTLFPRHRSLRVAFFLLAAAALVLRGLKPLSYASVTVFGPLFLLFGVLLQLYWCRIHLRRREVVPGA